MDNGLDDEMCTLTQSPETSPGLHISVGKRTATQGCKNIKDVAVSGAE